MTKTQATILTCLRINLVNAKTEAMRRHVQDQIIQFEKRIAPQPKPQPKPQPSWDRYIPNEQDT